MIVSDNGNFLDMGLPKQGTSLAPMVIKPAPLDLNVSKKVRYQSQFREQGVLLKPANFKEWRSKLDKLKQVVRRHNPSELQVHSSAFTMTKRRALTVGRRANTQIESECVDIEESILSKGADGGAEGEPLLSTSLTARQSEPGAGATVELADTSAAQASKAENDQQEPKETGKGDGQDSQLKPTVAQVRVVAEESCLGYLYPKKVKTTVQEAAAYGSRLGDISNSAGDKSGNIPGASNLEALMTYPKKIVSKSGAILGYSNVKYPRSVAEDLFNKQRQELKTASVMSPTSRRVSKGRVVYAELAESSQWQDYGDSRAVASTLGDELVADPAATPNTVEEAFLISGWDQGQPSVDDAAKYVLQQTRVGGVTFVKSTAVKADGQARKTGGATASARADKPAKSGNRKKKLGQHKSQPAIKNRPLRSSISVLEPGESRSKPLQLANLHVMMANLERTGNFERAHEEANRASRKPSSLVRLAPRAPPVTALIHRPLGMIKGAQSPASKSPMNESVHSLYAADDRGFNMRVGRSNIFEFGNEAAYHRMAPTLTPGLATQPTEREAYSTQPLCETEEEQLHSFGEQRPPRTSKGAPGHAEGRVASAASRGKSSHSQLTSVLEDTRMSNMQILPHRYLDTHESSTRAKNLSVASERSQHAAIGASRHQKPGVPLNKSPAHAGAATRKPDAELNLLVLPPQEARERMNAGESQSQLPSSTLSSQRPLNAKISQRPQGYHYQPSQHSGAELVEPGLMVQGGHAILYTMYQQNGIKDPRRAGAPVGAVDPNRQSNKDLHMLDPALTIVRGYAPQQKDSQLVAKAGAPTKELENDSVSPGQGKQYEVPRAHFSPLPRPGTEDVPAQWQVGSTPNTVFGYGQTQDNHFGSSSDNFTRREAATQGHDGGRIATSHQLASRRGSQGSKTPSESLGTGRNLPTMLQNVKYQLNNQASINRKTKPMDYGVVGRSVSPKLGGQFDAARGPRRVPQSREHTITFSAADNALQGQPNFNSLPQSRGQASGSTAAFAQPSVSSIPPGGSMMPIVIQQKSSSKRPSVEMSAANSDPQSELLGTYNSAAADDATVPGRKKSTQPQDAVTIDQIVTTNQKSGKKQRIGARGRGSKSKLSRMRFDDEGDYEAAEVVTVLGDQSSNLGLRISDERSRDRLGMQGETMKLEATSSKEIEAFDAMMKRGSDNSTGGAEVSSLDGAAAMKAQSPQAASIRTEEAHRQAIPIQRPEHGDQTTPQASHLSVGEEESTKLKSIDDGAGPTNIQVPVPMDSQPQPMDLDYEQETAGMAEAGMTPTDILFLEGASDEMIALQQLNLQPSMQINLGGKTKKGSTTKKEAGKANAGNNKSSITAPSGSLATTSTAKLSLKAKRSTLESVQRFKGSEKKRDRAAGMTQPRGSQACSVAVDAQRFHNSSALSSVNVNLYQRDSRHSPSVDMQKGFLPTLPFKNSNFARTQRAVKMMRQGPLNDRRRADDLSGQFIHLNDYAAIHGHFAPGDSRMYLRADEISGKAFESTAGASESKGFKMLNKSCSAQSSMNAAAAEEAAEAATFFAQSKQGSVTRPLTKTEMTSNRGAQATSHDFSTGKRVTSSVVEGSGFAPLGDNVSAVEQADQGANPSAVSEYRKSPSALAGNPMTPATSKANSRQPILAGQGTALLSDYIQSQRQNEGLAIGGDVRPKVHSVDREDESPSKQTKITAPAGQVMIKRRNSARRLPAEPRDQMPVENLGNAAVAFNMQRPRQVVVHKLTMQAERGITAATALRPTRELLAVEGSPKQLTQVGSGDSFAQPQQQHSQQQVSVQELSSVLRQTSDLVKGPNRTKSHAVTPHSTQQHSSLPNVGNLGVVMPVSFGIADGTRDPIALASNTFSEAKARQFLEKQRKRTSQHKRRSVYKVGGIATGGGEGEDLEDATAVLPAAARSPEPEAAEQSMADGLAPMLDVHADTAYDSGLMIQRATVNQGQAKDFIQSSKVAAAQRLSNPPTSSVIQPANLNAHATQQEKLRGSPRDVGKAQNLQRKVTLSKINQQPLNDNALVLTALRTPPTGELRRVSAPQEVTSLLNSVDEDPNAVNHGMTSNRDIYGAADPDDSPKYADYLRGGATTEIRSSSPAIELVSNNKTSGGILYGNRSGLKVTTERVTAKFAQPVQVNDIAAGVVGRGIALAPSDAADSRTNKSAMPDKRDCQC